MKFDNLTIKAQEALVGAQNLAIESKNQIIDIPHLLLALISEQGIPTEILGQLNANAQDIREAAEKDLAKIPKVEVESDQVYASKELSKCFKSAAKEAKDLGDEYISTEHLLISVVDNLTPSLKEEFKKYGITKDSILKILKNVPL